MIIESFFQVMHRDAFFRLLLSYRRFSHCRDLFLFFHLRIIMRCLREVFFFTRLYSLSESILRSFIELSLDASDHCLKNVHVCIRGLAQLTRSGVNLVYTSLEGLRSIGGPLIPLRECIVNSGALLLQPVAELLQDLFSDSLQLRLLHKLQGS